MKAFQAEPCAECPWRTDVPPGRFPPARFVALAHTAYDMSLVQFGCHKSGEEDPIGCAGFVRRGATHNLGARLAAGRGVIDLHADHDDENLFANYRAMAIANGVDPGHPALKRCR